MMASARVISFGFLHGPAPTADLVLDVREVLRDPHVSPAFRELTGLDEQVRSHVLDTANAAFIVTNRSVAVASVVAERLSAEGWSVDLEHRHVHLPVVRRPDRDGA